MRLSECIRDNMEYLIGHLSNIKPLLVYLRQEKMLTPEEVEDIEEKGSTSKMSREFFEIIQKKDWEEDKSDKFLGICEAKGNEAVARKLRTNSTPQNMGQFDASQGATTVPTTTKYKNFKVEDYHVNEIARVLSQKVPVKDWADVMDDLLTMAMKNEVPMDTTHRQKVTRCIAVWVMKMDSKDRWFSTIVDAVRLTAGTAAEELEKNASDLEKMK